MILQSGIKKVEALRNALAEGIRSGTDKDFDPKKFLAELKEAKRSIKADHSSRRIN